ncbi:MAG: endonuclease Q family protein [Promethearchaeota archaeon]
MDSFNADLHIHSPHSIAVSQSLNFDTMIETSRKKGLNILATGDILQPDWLKYAESKLEKNGDGAYSYKGIHFVLQSEIEDAESVHEVVLFPDFKSVREVQEKLKSRSKNILKDWGGRPIVNLSPAELVDVITDSGGMIGPAHAFTPFKAIFRQNKFSTLEECYQDAVKKISFLELGLSANTELADKMNCLKDVSFLSNSDAHSQSPRSLGREFNRLDLDNPSFEEIRLALERKDNRKITLNVGLNPKLGKYFIMFCNHCRRRVLFEPIKKDSLSVLNTTSISDNFITIYSSDINGAKNQYIKNVSRNKINCPACEEELKKNYKIRLGVSERIDVISDNDTPIHPKHRPPYLNSIPLIDIIRSVKGIKNHASKTISKAYDDLINTLGEEFSILIDIHIKEIEKKDEKVAQIISALRKEEIQYTPGGGGTYGELKFDAE